LALLVDRYPAHHSGVRIRAGTPTNPDGAPENVVRTVTQNGRDLEFTSAGFETE
jgi:hypothetical protein